jgi:hypothetical protein
MNDKLISSKSDESVDMRYFQIFKDLILLIPYILLQKEQNNIHGTAVQLIIKAIEDHSKKIAYMLFGNEKNIGGRILIRWLMHQQW